MINHVHFRFYTNLNFRYLKKIFVDIHYQFFILIYKKEYEYDMHIKKYIIVLFNFINISNKIHFLNSGFKRSLNAF